MEAAIEAGADDVETNEDEHEILCAGDDLHTVSSALEDQFGAPSSAKLIWRPQNSIPVVEDKVASLLKFLDVLDDNDDVQTVTANFDIADDVMERVLSQM
jgi:transcriptional/translational regulatory protein YebC/TACO1